MASRKKIRPRVKHIYHLDGKILPQTNYCQSDITILPNNQFICTCGNLLTDLYAFNSHKKTLRHLILTQQIDENHPTLTIHVQRDMLLSSSKKIW
jgi:hypothetical protein